MHADTQPTRCVLSLAAILSAPVLSLVAAPQDTEWPGPDSAESTHKHILAHTSQQVPRAGSTGDWDPGSRVPLDTQHLVAVTAHGNTPTAARTAGGIHPSHTCPLSRPAPYLRANCSHLKVVEGAYRGRRAVLGPGAHVSAWRQEGRGEAEAGGLASRAPGETESQREDSRAATSRRGTDGGRGGAGSRAEGEVTRSPLGLEGGLQRLKIAWSGGCALQLDPVSARVSLSLSFSLSRISPSRPALATPLPPRPGC